MSRFPNVRKGRKPRNKHVMLHILTTAQSLYLETGGADIDFTVDAAKQVVDLCRERAAQPQPERGPDPVKMLQAAIRELRMAQQMREKKLNECRQIIAETSEAAEQEAAPAKQPETHGTGPEPTAIPAGVAPETPETRHDQSNS